MNEVINVKSLIRSILCLPLKIGGIATKCENHRHSSTAPEACRQHFAGKACKADLSRLSPSFLQS